MPKQTVKKTTEVNEKTKIVVRPKTEEDLSRQRSQQRSQQAKKQNRAPNGRFA